MSRDEKIVKILKRVLPIMSIITLFVFVMLINKKSYALFHKRIETDITIHISTADKMPVKYSDSVQKIVDKTNDTNSVTDEDGIIYLSGSNEDIDFNYVWYSGKLWRITAIYPDGTMKMITQNTMTSIYWGSKEKYEGSWVYQWLNEDFKDTLYNYQNIIVQNASWNATETNNYSTKIPETTMVEGNVGLLNAYEYYQSYKKLGTDSTAYSNGYLNTEATGNTTVMDFNIWGLLINKVVSRGQIMSSGNDAAVRPSVILKSDIKLSGDGSKENPYRIEGDKETGKSGELINTRLSGEYVKVDNKVYRIMGIENNTAKLISTDSIFAGHFGENPSWSNSVASEEKLGYYLNNTWITENLKQYITNGTYYLGYVNKTSYKDSVCSESNTTDTIKECQKTSSTWTGLVGIPRIGEMLLSNFNFIALITPQCDSCSYHKEEAGILNAIGPGDMSPWDLGNYGALKEHVTPTINLKSEIIISSGSGTEDDPYTVSIS